MTTPPITLLALIEHETLDHGSLWLAEGDRFFWQALAKWAQSRSKDRGDGFATLARAIRDCTPREARQ